MIRLSTAHAKARLSTKVTQADAAEAEAVLRFALFKEVVKRVVKRKKRKLNTAGAAAHGTDSEAESGEESSEDEAPAAPRMSVPPQQALAKKAKALEDPVWGEDSQDVPMDADADVRLPPAGTADDGSVRPER